MSEHRPSDERGGDDSGFLEEDAPVDEDTEPADEHATEDDRERRATHTPEQLQEYLECWTLPGGRLAPEQIRALLAWRGTPDEERRRLRASLETVHQQVPARSLAPNQRRGHVSWLDRLKGFFRP